MLEEKLSPAEYVTELADFFSDRRTVDTTLGPTDAGFVYISLKCLGNIIKIGFIDGIIAEIMLPLDRIYAMAVIFRDEDCDEFIIEAVDAGIVYVALRCLGKLMAVGLIDPHFEV